MNWLAIDAIIRAALQEDLGHGDITTELLPGAERQARGVFTAKAQGMLCGSEVAARCFALYGAARAEFSLRDGAALAAGQDFGTVAGPGGDILSVERVALNFLQRLSGIATRTRRFVELAAGSAVRITETRKTTPTLRTLEKYAVRVGGGHNHRFDLDSAVMLKDNHFALAGGDPGDVVRQVKARASHMMKVVAEAASPEMALLLAGAGADVVLLDNFTPEQVRGTVAQLKGPCIVEVSGGITEDNIGAYLIPGVDVISIGALTHRVTALDISLEFAAE